MSRVIFQPAGSRGARKHYETTVEKPVSLNRIARFVDAETISQLREEHQSESVAVWGVTPGASGGNEKKWNAIQRGDLALFLGEGAAYASGVVTVKLRNPRLARELWGQDESGNTWEFMYFLRDIRACDLSYRDVNQAAGYEPANPFQGVNLLDEARSQRVIQLVSSAATVGAARFWWVNQGSSYRQERAGNFVWAPKQSKSGTPLSHHRNVTRLEPGDTLIHYANGYLRAVSKVAGPPKEERRPSEIPGGQWNDDGYLAPTAYRELEPPIALDQIPVAWRTSEGSRADGEVRAFNRQGSVAQGYLYRVSDEFVRRLRDRFPGLIQGNGEIQKGDLGRAVGRLSEDFRRAGLQFSDEALSRFLAALLTKPFVILTGLSGSGKTKLAQGLAWWLGCNPQNERCAVVAVGPDWTNTESVLGYPNALDEAAYARTQTLDLLLRATQQPDIPHFVILDEMNLSHVERYFADILSAMESGAPVHLHSGSVARQDVPSQMTLPRNLFVVGTVNVDETTYMFSPKVLDRANVLEFRADLDRLQELVAAPRRPDLESLLGSGREFASYFASTREPPKVPTEVLARLRIELSLFFDALAAEGYEFGYRTAVEIAEFLAWHAQVVGPAWTFEIGFDAQIVQKLLPRIHGSRRRIEGVLSSLASLCVEPRQWIESDGQLTLTNQVQLKDRAREAAEMSSEDADPLRVSQTSGNAPAYPLSFAKVVRMLRNLDRNGFTSFAEA